MRLTTQEAIDYLQKKDINTTWEFYKAKSKSARTLKQNNMFKWLFSEIGKHQWRQLYEVQMFFMKFLFWIKEMKMFWASQEIPIINSTTKLTKMQAIDLIDNLLHFIQEHDIPCKYSSLELKSLYDSYK